MKKFLLFVFIVLDLIIIGLAGFFLYTRLQSGQSPLIVKNALQSMSPPKPATVPSASPTASLATSTMTAMSPTPQASGVAPISTTRKIGFSYRNSKPRKVLLRGDFTGWKGEPMVKDATGVWRFTAVLEPGEYGYLYSVDDVQKLDPANKKTKKIGNTTVSAITVLPAPSPKK
jgi:hypothetical protein